MVDLVMIILKASDSKATLKESKPKLSNWELLAETGHSLLLFQDPF